MSAICNDQINIINCSSTVLYCGTLEHTSHDRLPCTCYPTSLCTHSLQSLLRNRAITLLPVIATLSSLQYNTQCKSEAHTMFLQHRQGGLTSFYATWTQGRIILEDEVLIQTILSQEWIVGKSLRHLLDLKLRWEDSGGLVQLVLVGIENQVELAMSK